MTWEENIKSIAVAGIGAALYPTVHGFVKQFLGGIAGQIAGIEITKLAVALIAAWGADRVKGLAAELVAGIGIGAVADLASPYVGGFMKKETTTSLVGLPQVRTVVNPYQ
jgi:fucose permease